MSQNIFALGLDDLGLEELRTLPAAEQYNFRQLLTFEELQEGTVSLPDLLDRAQRQLDAFDGSIDAIVGYWDFPASMLVPILCDRYGLRSKSLEAVVKCEHKYWSRLEQQKVIDAYPAFDLIDIDDPSATLPDHMSYPAWIKPIKSFSSEGAHYVGDEEQLQEALSEERRAARRLGGAFDDVLEMINLPEDVAGIGGSAFMVEEAARGEQFTVEGFSRGDQVEIYGVIDSVTYEQSSSFLRYQYPSRLPAHVQEKMVDVSRQVITAVGLTESAFNIEYFWDAATERLNLLEVNTRHSQSHAPLFRLVDGRPNHSVMVDLALDRDPHLPRREGQFKTAAKWFLRRFSDGVVHRVPTQQDIAGLEQKLPGTTVAIVAEEGTRLSEAEGEGSYSYTLAEIFTAGGDEAELVDNYDQVVAALDFEIEDLPEEN